VTRTIPTTGEPSGVRSGSELPIAIPVTKITVETRYRFRSDNMILALGECHVESQNSGQRGTVFWNHSRLLCPRLFVGGHSGLKPGRTLRGMVACAKGPSGV